ncbi:MAG: glycosyltransferase [Candidatus Babeliaceae bacterium]
MKRKYIKALILIVFCLFFIALILSWCKSSQLEYVDFDESMQAQKYAHIIKRGAGENVYEIFKKVYEKNNFLRVKPEENIKIPRIIHQIWIQGNPPAEFTYVSDSWQKYHPSWRYVLWTDKEIKKLKYLPHDLYDAAVNYGEKSDIARYAILYEYGGLYADFDEECLQACDALHYRYDFYIGIQPLDTNTVQVGIGIIGAVPGHPLLKYVIDSLHNAHHIPQIVAKTGPIFFTYVFCSVIFNISGINIALPASYFYPRGYTQNADKRIWQKPESLAVHHWAGSWLKKEAFVH